MSGMQTQKVEVRQTTSMYKLHQILPRMYVLGTRPGLGVPEEAQRDQG